MPGGPRRIRELQRECESNDTTDSSPPSVSVKEDFVLMTGSLRRDNERDKSEAAQDNTDEEDHFPDRVPRTAPFNSVHGRATQPKRRR